MDLFAERIKDRKYNWSYKGLEAMLFSLIKRYEGTLADWIGKLKSSLNSTIEKETLNEGAGRIPKKITKEALES